jgi:hypothetical protein
VRVFRRILIALYGVRAPGGCRDDEIASSRAKLIGAGDAVANL